MEHDDYDNEMLVMTAPGLSQSEIALRLYEAYLGNPHVDPTLIHLDLILLARKIYALDEYPTIEPDYLDPDACS